MKFFVTHSDENYVSVTEILFDSLKLTSVNKIIYYTVGFTYDNSKYDNVIPIRVNPDDYEQKDMMFMKADICKLALSFGDHEFCYVDADCVGLKTSDSIFESSDRITTYPLLGINSQEYMYRYGRGMAINPDGSRDNTKCLEIELLRLLEIPIEKRTPLYRQSNVILFNAKCVKILDEWISVSNNKKVVSEWEAFAPLKDETVINCLLWRDGLNDNLSRASINLPSNIGGTVSPEPRLVNFTVHFNNPKENMYRYDTFCAIPSRENITDIKFLHGKLTDEQYKIIKDLILTRTDSAFGAPANRTELFRAVLPEFIFGLGVEVGTFKGKFSKEIVNNWLGTLYMVDVWRPLSGEEYDDMSNHKNAEVYSEAIDSIRGYEDRAIMVRGASKDVVGMFPDNHLDFVYIDANHAYEHVKQDIELWYPKVRRGGYLMGHDYLRLDWYNDPNFHPNGKDKYIWSNGSYMGLFGVNPAVDEFCARYNYSPIITGEWLGSWAIKKI